MTNIFNTKPWLQYRGGFSNNAQQAIFLKMTQKGFRESAENIINKKPFNLFEGWSL